MIKVILALKLFVYGVLLFDQNGYNIIFEYAETIHFDSNYFEDFHVISFKYNRTKIALNNTFWTKVDINKNIKMEVQAYKFASNEYRVFPMRFSVNLCTAIAHNDFGLHDIYKCGNMSRCPFKKGRYLTCNWMPDASKFPPYIPQGRYMLDVKFFVGSTEICFYRTYSTIQDHNKWDHYY